MSNIERKTWTNEQAIEALHNLKALNRPDIKYAFSPWQMGNMSLKWAQHGQDEVLHNRQKFLDIAGFGNTRTIILNVQSKNNIELVDHQTNDNQLPFADALITTEKNLNLAFCPADCSPIIIFCPNKALALIHAGLPGSELDITQKTVNKLVEMGVNPGEMVAGIGPSIQCYYRDQLKTHNPEKWLPYVSTLSSNHAKIICKTISNEHFLLPKNKESKLWVDLDGYNKNQLIQAGIPETSISISRICTRCNTDNHLLFSHAASFKNKRKNEGRFLAIAARV